MPTFQEIREFLSEHNKRENRELEKRLFKIINSFDPENLLLSDDYDKEKYYKLRIYKRLKKFIASLNEDQQSTNLYLQMASTFIKFSQEDCEYIIRRLKEQLDYSDLAEEKQKLKLNVNLPPKRFKLFPNTIKVQAKATDSSLQNEIAKEDMQLYSDYNTYVRNIYKLATVIYHLQMWNLLSVYPERISNYSFTIVNNDSKHEFRTAYFVQRYREIGLCAMKKVQQLSQNSELDNGNVTLDLDNSKEQKQEACEVVKSHNPVLKRKRNKKINLKDQN